MAEPRTAAGCDPWQMALIHRLILTGFEQAENAVRSPRATERRREITEYLQFHLDGLAGHHTSEDEHLWPRLRERAPMSTDLVERMEQAHRGLHSAIDDVHRDLIAWPAAPSATAAEDLADSVSKLRDGLAAHLGDEEENVVPLIAVHISQDEWEANGKAAFDAFTPKQRFTAMGEMLQTATPQEAARMLAELPLPIRIAWRLLGRPRYQRLMVGVRG